MIGWRMRPTASALGVIAIATVMITVTASEADSGAIEASINDLGMAEVDRRGQEDDRAAGNLTAIDDLVTRMHLLRSNDTASEIPLIKDSPAVHPTRENQVADASRTRETIRDDVQRDQSGASLIGAAANGVPETEYSSESSMRMPGERNDAGNKARHDYPASTRPSDSEIASSTDPWFGQGGLPAPRQQDQADGARVDGDAAASNVVDREVALRDKFGAGYPHGTDPFAFTAASVRAIGPTTMAKPVGRKNVEDIRAISFQVPAPAEEEEEEKEEAAAGESAKSPPGMEGTRNAAETRKDHSRPVNNLLLAGGKSTKAFYEIKPSIKTEMDGDPLSFSSSQKPLVGRKFVLPSVDSAFGKFGPYFEDGDQEMNITARIGSTMLLDCKIGMLGDKKVTWLQQHSKDSFRLLTVDKTAYSVDERISLNFRYPSNWRLQIVYANPRDSGLYKCQVATHPPLVKTINVVVTAPELTITDDSGRVVAKERHLKAGSALKLRCEARDVMESLKESVVWTRGDETLTEDVSENRTTEIVAGKEILVIVSTLIVEKATPRHAGNYSCVVPEKTKTTIAVHVLNGELPAAVHDGNGVSRAFLNLWLIHLTMSYVFSR